MRLLYLLHTRRQEEHAPHTAFFNGWPWNVHFDVGRFIALAVFLALSGLLPTPASAVAKKPSLLPPGMFHTRGNQIVDRNGTPVRLSCIYWAGLNALDHPLANLHRPFHGYQANVNAMAAAGFNCIRVDFNNISLHKGNVSGFLSALDQVVGAAKNARMRVIIVDHDNEGDYGSRNGYTNDCAAQQANGVWYDKGGASDGTDGCKDPGTVTPESFQSDWVGIATRYAGNNTVIGYDLWNEPVTYGSVGSTWGDGTNRDIHRMHETVGSAILAQDSSKLIFAACPFTYTGTLFDGTKNGHAPWGDCTGVKADPVVFTVGGRKIADKVVYVIHLYPNSVSGISKLFGSSSSPSAVRWMNRSFGYLESENIAPVWDGESGTGFAHNPDDRNWADMLVAYLNGDLGAQGGPTFHGDQQGMGFAWMAWETPEKEGDNLGILNSDGSLVAAQKAVVNQLLYYKRQPRQRHRGHGDSHDHNDGHGAGAPK